MNKKEMLQSLINHYTGGNKAAFARILNITPQTLSKWISRNTFDNELLFQKFPDISPYWLLTGEGEMLAAPAAPHITQTVTSSSHVTQTAARNTATDLAALLAAKEEMLAAKDETISALRQSLTDKERLIRTLLAAQNNQQQ